MTSTELLIRQMGEVNHLLKQVGSLKTSVREALASLEDARLNIPKTVDRNEVDQNLKQLYEGLRKITQQDTQFLKKKWQNQ